MKTQFGKTQLINLATVNLNGSGVVVAAEGYRVDFQPARKASERLSPDCRESGPSMRTLRPKMLERLSQSFDSLWRSDAQRAVTTIDPGAATIPAQTAGESRLPAPAWAAFVLNHALCG